MDQWMNNHKLPIREWIDQITEFMTTEYQPFFDAFKKGVGVPIDSLTHFLQTIPIPVFIIGIVLLSWLLTKKKSMTIFTLIGFLYIYNMDLWKETMETLSLVLSSAFISFIIGIPIGIWSARNDVVRDFVTPILDMMQTMPAFVYLLPAIMFFSIGVVPGVLSSVVFAMPPTIRLTNLGIRQVPSELVEAADSFGSTGGQKLWKVQIPLALPTIMAGINQTIMLSLSMVVIASMIGASGLGEVVLYAVTNLEIGVGFEAGLAVVVLAIILDRLTQNLGQRKNNR